MHFPWWARIAAVAFVAHGAWHWWHDRPVAPPPGVLAPREPVQTPLDDAPPLAAGRWTLTPRAEYALTARVLGRETYRWDGIAELVPVDLALGWGPMSDGAVLERLEIEQGARFYTLRWSADPPLPGEMLLRHSANVHVIPADEAIAARLRTLRRGQVVELRGRLVDGRRDDGASFRTSLTRDDTGAGACEVLRVEHVAVP